MMLSVLKMITSCLLDFFTDYGQVGESEWRTIGLNHFHEVQIMKIKFIINDVKTFLWEANA